MMRPVDARTPRVPAEAVAEEGSENGAIVASLASDGKAVATLKAQLAIAGHAVHELATGGYLVVATRWAGMCRECPDVRSLAAFARQIGACR
jgi:hypothetical protein